MDMSAPIGGSVVNPLAAGRSQFLGLLHGRMVDRLVDPAVLRDVLDNHYARSTVPDDQPTSDRLLREAVRMHLSRPVTIMALFEAAQRECSNAPTSSLALLGTATAFGSALARAKLMDLARSSTEVAAPAREILRYSVPLRAAAALPYSLAFLVPLERMVRDFHARLAVELNRQTDRQGLVELWSALVHGPIRVIYLLKQLVPNGTTSTEEIWQVGDVYHDTVGSDLTNLGYLRSLLTRVSREYLQSAFTPKKDRALDSAITAAIAAEALLARQHSVQVRWYYNERRNLSQAFPHRECALIVRELVHNAVKYADPAKPERWLRFRWVPETYMLMVEDNGVGIRDTTTIWERGIRERPDLADGTGLGLGSARRRAMLNGWMLTVTSTVGEGSAFALQLKPADFVERPRR